MRRTLAASGLTLVLTLGVGGSAAMAQPEGGEGTTGTAQETNDDDDSGKLGLLGLVGLAGLAGLARRDRERPRDRGDYRSESGVAGTR